MEEKRKSRIAFFDFACCEGCQLTVLQMEESLFRMLDQVEVVAWREVMTGESDDYDVAFCEGSIARRSDLKRLEKIRKTAKILVALGSCAALECHNALRNRWSARQLSEMVYGNEAQVPDLIPAVPVSRIVPVDYQVLGCPVSLPEFKEVFHTHSEAKSVSFAQPAGVRRMQNETTTLAFAKKECSAWDPLRGAAAMRHARPTENLAWGAGG